jgi:ribosomal protein S18 acetylase RimI-like enzyme
VIRIETIDEHHYDTIINQLDAWWGGREMVQMLPRLWFKHFQDTSFVALDQFQIPIGFLVGFISTSDQSKAYVHFIGVNPEHRGKNIGSSLYGEFFKVAQNRNCELVEAVTSPSNLNSLAFHESLEFYAVEPSGEKVAPLLAKCFKDYDGPNEDRVQLRKSLKD